MQIRMMLLMIAVKKMLSFPLMVSQRTWLVSVTPMKLEPIPLVGRILSFATVPVPYGERLDSVLFALPLCFAGCGYM